MSLSIASGVGVCKGCKIAEQGLDNVKRLAGDWQRFEGQTKNRRLMRNWQDKCKKLPRYWKIRKGYWQDIGK